MLGKTSPWYKFYTCDDEDEVHVSMFLFSHQIGYGSKTCKHKWYPHHHQNYLTTTNNILPTLDTHFVQVGCQGSGSVNCEPGDVFCLGIGFALYSCKFSENDYSFFRKNMITNMKQFFFIHSAST